MYENSRPSPHHPRTFKNPVVPPSITPLQHPAVPVLRTNSHRSIGTLPFPSVASSPSQTTTVHIHTHSSHPVHAGLQNQCKTPPITPLPTQHTSSPSQCTSPQNYSPLLNRNCSIPRTSSPAIHPKKSLLQAAVVDLTIVIRSNHQDSKQLICNLGEEFFSGLSTLSSSVEILKEAVASLPPKIEKKATNIDVAFGHIHDWIKAQINGNQLDHSSGDTIFPSTRAGYPYSSVVLMAIEKFMDMSNKE